MKPGPKRKPLKERFAAKVKPGSSADCWEWQGTIKPNGYGIISKGGDSSKCGVFHAHHVAYEISNGIDAIPAGMVVMHKCDNRKCVNPSHLAIGTAKDNVHDCIRKGRAWWQSVKCRRDNAGRNVGGGSEE